MGFWSVAVWAAAPPDVQRIEGILIEHGPIEVLEISRLTRGTLGASQVFRALDALEAAGVARRVVVAKRHKWEHVPGTRWVPPAPTRKSVQGQATGYNGGTSAKMRKRRRG